jgi:hypothetical protein
MVSHKARRSIMKRFSIVWAVSGCLLLTVFGFAEGGKALKAGTHTHPSASSHHGSHGADHFREPASPLAEPGNDVFGTVQEVIQRLEADPETDWSKVDLEALRQHLIDMHQVAFHVEVISRDPLENGVRLVVRGTTPQADASLSRVLAAHPEQLRKETGWTMAVKKDGSGYELRVTGTDPRDAVKIRGLGYIGLLAYGNHHQPHHWEIATGGHPHSHE